MADTNAAVEEARRRALEAMATQGQAGVDALRAGQMQVAQTQQQAVDTALAGSIARGAPAGAADDLTAIISQPGDIAQTILTSAAARAQQDQAAMSGATASYFDQVSGAMPVLQAALDREIVQANADYARQQEAQNFQALQRQWAIEDRARAMEEDAAAAAAGAAGGGRYGGYSTAGEYENAATGLALELQSEAERQANLRLAESREEQQFRNRASAQAGYDQQQAQRQAGNQYSAPIGPGLPPAQVRVPPAAGTIGPPPAAPPLQLAPLDRQRVAAVENAAAGQESIARRTQSGLYEDMRALPGILGSPAMLPEYQRDAAINYLGGDPFDAYGRFPDLSPLEVQKQAIEQANAAQSATDLALQQAFMDAFGVAPTGARQLQDFARGEDPFDNEKPGKPVASPVEAARAGGFDLAELRAIEAPILDAAGKPTDDVVPVFDAAVDEMGAYLEQGYPVAEAAELLAQDMRREFGTVFRRVLATVVSMYGG